jgi:hypothetical protein
MGYLMFITRGDHWSDDAKERITAEEWRKVVESHPKLELWEGETDVYTVKGCDGITPALGYNDETGTIWIRAGYFEEVLPVVLELAGKLRAVVQGEAGEYYLITENGRETTRERPQPPTPHT